MYFKVELQGNNINLELRRGKVFQYFTLRRAEDILTLNIPEDVKQSLGNAIELLRGVSYIKAVYLTKKSKRALRAA